VRQPTTELVSTVDPKTPVDEIADAVLQQGIGSIVAIDDDCCPSASRRERTSSASSLGGRRSRRPSVIA